MNDLLAIVDTARTVQDPVTGLSAADTIAEALMKYETLTGEEIGAIARGDNLEDFRAAQERAQRTSVDGAKSSVEEDEPDVGLSGAEGLAHP